MNLTEFLLARIAEDEAEARSAGADAMMGARWKHWSRDAYEEIQSVVLAQSRCVLAECEAKRAIVGLQAENDERRYLPGFHYKAQLIEGVLRTLATVYADHEDFRPEWRV